ncbi:YcaO-like family protein [Pyxidicoccus parkwayensis]|uniref:YcaO-like family protein n=1 Tax=Pyxidicoccus parkwayensis TaxID=2813578 RepID=A0ABX7NYM5_9BACT|nr:YcaO-like family protein [Pyxidicoccus parkwaysis]QSQ23954.1 YcaO-like family protein [Pyxidicoccus parkwaysis]
MPLRNTLREPEAAPSSAGTSKRFRLGTHRVVSPQQTLERVRRLMPALGITRIANVTGLDTIGIPVVMVARPNARSLAVSQGKGLTLDAAKASGLMESVEGYHAEHISLPLKLGTYNELRFREAVVDVAGLPRLSVSLFHDNWRMLWVEGVNLMQGTTLWLPFDLVHTDYTLPLPTGSGAFLMSSNGLASGNHVVEATLHGLCEVVERDSTTLWHARGPRAQAKTRLDLGSVDDESCREVLEKYARAGVAVGAWETTSDVGVPAFTCSIVDREPEAFRPVAVASGMGCHPSREVALLRALTEAAQSRLTRISGARDDLHRKAYESAKDGVAAERLRARLREESPVRRFQDVPTYDGETLEDDLAWVLGKLGEAGLSQVVAVDLTKPELGVPVVRVVVPGLEPTHEAPGYVPGVRAQRVMRGRDE